MIKNSQLLDLSGKSAIVTGGAKGIGLGIAKRLDEAGANVLIADLDENAGEKAAAGLNRASFIKVDVASEEDIKSMVNFCAEKFGGLNILVNNAGIFPSEPIALMRREEFDKVMNVNLRSAFLATKYASEQMIKESKPGKIINITSIDALHPSMVGLAHYDASKHGLWGFTKNSALELSEHNIQVNAIAPGGILTPGVEAMQSKQTGSASQIEAFLNNIPMHRLGDPDEIGKVALFLASDMSSYMTGEQIVVDGGALLK